MRIIAGLFALAAICLLARPAAAQSRADDPDLALRGFAVVSEQAFAAQDSFEAAFGQSILPFYGGGLELVSRGYFLDIAASRFRKTGERAFIHNGETFHLGIPLTVTITPLEFTFGYRFFRSHRVVPYAGAGIGSYRYQETSQQSDAAEAVDTREAGYLATGGAEFGVTRWFRVGIDVQYSYVPDILGEGGLSEAAGESDLGGLAARLKFVVGR